MKKLVFNYLKIFTCSWNNSSLKRHLKSSKICFIESRDGLSGRKRKLFMQNLFYLLCSSFVQVFWAGWGEHQMRTRRKRRTRKRTKSPRTPVPPKSPRVTRKRRRTSSPKPQLCHRPQHVRTAQNSAKFVERLGLEWVLLNLCLSVASSDPNWTIYRLPLSWWWWVTHTHTLGDYTEINRVWRDYEESPAVSLIFYLAPMQCNKISTELVELFPPNKT